MERYRTVLKQIEKNTGPALLSDHQIICRQLPYKEEAQVLYLARSHWTNRFDPNRASTVGIFFSIWVTPKMIEQQQLAYNIHAKQLRNLPGYKLASRKFADDFRKAVKHKVANWPAVSMDRGPVTLLEGRESCTLDNFASTVEKRVFAFVGIHQEIDKLLDASV